MPVPPDGTLVVKASSSDEVNKPVLTVTGTGFGALTGAGTAASPASASFPAIAAPSTITVTSARGGSATSAVSVAGAALVATLPVAVFTAPNTVSAGQPVVLDGTPSTGGPLTYSFTQLSGPAVALSGATTSIATFTPTVAGSYVIQLVVAGPVPPSLVSVPVSRTITVTPAAATLKANAGPDQTKQRGTLVTLDGSATVGARSLAWTQTAGPAVTLSSASAAKPTFTYPLMSLPTAPVGAVNPFYAVSNQPLTFLGTATGVDGSTTSTDTVVVSPLAESITGVTARYRTGRGGWRVTGTTSILAGQRVTVVLGPLVTGRTIGTATVDPAGAFSVRAGASPDPRVPTPDASQVTVVSQTGGIATAGLTITR